MTRPQATGPAACPSCGAERPQAPSAPEDTPVTHCEWCGAEYPLPGDEPGADARRGASPSGSDPGGA
jgi:hypothetical protein